MAYEFKMNRRVEFSDTDMAGIVHFSVFLRFMEETEHAFYRSLGFSVYERGETQDIGWPRVYVECEYRSPLRFEDVVEIHLLVKEKTEKSLLYTFRFNKVNEQPVRELARGSLKVVCVRRERAQDEMIAIPIPQEIADRIEVAPQEITS